MTERRRADDFLLEEYVLAEEEAFRKLNERMEKVETTVNELKEIMLQAKGAVTFIKVLAAIGGTLGAVYIFFHDFFTIVPK